MKKALGIIAIAIFCFGCNMNPNKEARIQKLETEFQQAVEKIKLLEKRMETLENNNAQLISRMHEPESE